MTTDLKQGSAEWLRARVGKVTASRVADIVAKTKTGYGSSRGNYMAELIAERLTGVPAEKFVSSAMAWGTNTEDEARAAYEFHAGLIVETVGLVPHPSIPMSAASPDGYAGEGLVEIKCPQTATHLDTLLGQAIPSKYQTQMFWQMCCTGRPWADFISYDPRMPEQMRLFVQRLHRDDERIAELEKEVTLFLGELEEKLGKLIEIYSSERKAA